MTGTNCKGKWKKGKASAKSTAALDPLPSNALADYQAEGTEQWESTCKKHAEISESVGKKDLPGLMNHDPEDPHGILTLAPNQLQPCASTIRGYVEAVRAFTSELDLSISAAEEDLLVMMHQHMFSNTDYNGIRVSLQSAREKEVRAVDGSKLALEKMNGNMSTGQALLLRHTQEAVDHMDEDKKMEEFEKLERQLWQEHFQTAEDGIGKLLANSKLPGLHDDINLKWQLKESLGQKAADVTSKRHDADMLYAELLKNQAEVRDKKQKCSELRGKTIRAEEAERQALDEAVRAARKAWEKYRYAFVRREAAAMMEDNLEAEDEKITKEVEDAGVARDQMTALCEQCEVKAATRTMCLVKSIEAAHAKQLDYSKPSVEEAWRNAAIASELCKCVMTTMRTSMAKLSKEQFCFTEQAQRQKQPKKKAQTLEKVEQLGRQIAEITDNLTKFEQLYAVAIDRLLEFKAKDAKGLKTGLDEEAIIRDAEEAAIKCYGDPKLYVSDEDSDDSTEASGSTEAIQPHVPNEWEKRFLELEAKTKTQEAQFKMTMMSQLCINEMQEKLRQLQEQRDDASNASTLGLGFEKLDC